MSPIEERMPELSTRIIGGLGVLLLSPNVLTAASRYRQELAASTSIPDPSTTPNQAASGPAAGRGVSPDPGCDGPRPGPGPKPLQNPKPTADRRPAAGRTDPADRKPMADWRRGDLRTRIAVTASGLVAATSVVYTAPGTPWARTNVLAAPLASDLGALPGHADLDHEGATYSDIVRDGDGTVLVDATPVHVGINTIAVTVLDAKGALADVRQWSATASLPGAGVPDVPVPLKSFGEGVAAADADLPVAGTWSVSITVQVADADPTSFTHDIPIASTP